MYLLIDESKQFIFETTPIMEWKIAVVAGAILPYKGRKIWLKSHKAITKGSDYAIKDEEKICDILDILIKCRVKGILQVGDIGHVSLQDAEKFRQNWITPHYTYADTQPQCIQKSLRLHLENLKGEGQNKFSIQEFFKILSILETITSFIQWLTQELLKVQAIDLRKIKLIIDDQVKASLIILRSFTHYFLFQRSQNGLFTAPPNSSSLLRDYLREEKGQTYLDSTKLFDKLIIGENTNMDDKYPELKIADLLSNFSRRALNGDFSIRVAERLKKILIAVNPVCFDNFHDINVELPDKNQDAIKLILS